MTPIHKRDGFRGEIQYVIPEPILERVGRHLLVSGLHPTDVGWYPAARHHFRQRESGAAQHILILCAEGRGWFELQGQRQSLAPGQALFIPRALPHAYGADDLDPWSIHWLHFLGEDAPYFFTLLRRDNPVVPVAEDLMPRLQGLFTEARSALADGFSEPGIICAAQAVRHLLALLFFENRAFHPHTKAPSTGTLERTLQFLRERVDSPLTVAEMAREAGLSETHFARLFRRHTGFSPMDYFIHLKMQQAARMLTLTRLRVHQVADRLGYDDPYYFSRLFRKIMGAPPSEYRKEKLGTLSAAEGSTRPHPDRTPSSAGRI